MSEKNRLLVIDSNSLIHRAFHALPPFRTRTGELTNAVYGFLLVLFKAIKEFHPEYIAATFDMPGPTKRHKAYAGYKAQRVKAPDELYAQMPRVKEMLSVFGIPVYEKQGSEADDLIGTIAKQAQRQQAHPKPEVIIVSGDMDALQLVNDQVKVFATRRGLQDVALFDKKAVQAKFSGLLPTQLPDYKGLRGDPSDNIPGVRGVGEKTAITLLLQFNSLENIYKKIEKKDAEGISPALRTTLLASKEDAFISKELGTIDTDVPIDFKLKDCIWKGYDRQQATEKLKELEFFSLVDKLPAPIHALKAEESPQEQSLEERIKQLEESSVLPPALADLERKLIPIIGGMEKAGMKIDRQYFTKLAGEMDEKMRGIEKEVYAMAGQQFNLNSPAQLSVALFQTLGLSSKGVKKTPGGVFSTASDELEKIYDLHPIVSQVVAYRELKKLLSTYALPLLEKADANDRVHTSFDQFGAATGRLSCLPAGTQINTQRGLIGIEDVRPGDLVRTPYGPRRVLDWQQTGKKEVVALRFSNNIILRCSPDHRIRTGGEWVKASDVTVGTPAYMSSTSGMFGAEVMLNAHPIAKYRTKKSPILPMVWTEDLAELVGYTLADGHIVRSNYNDKPSKLVLAFGWEETGLISHFEQIIQKLFGKHATRRITRTCPTLEVSGVDIAGFLEQIGAGGRSQMIRVPSIIFRAPETIVAALLRGYFEGDGHVGNDTLSVRSTSLLMLKDVQQLLTLFGIPSSVFKGTDDPRGFAPRYTLYVIGDRSKKTFLERINFISKRKREACAKFTHEYREKSKAELLTLPAHFDIEHIKPYLYAVYRETNERVPGPVMTFAHKFVAGRQALPFWRAKWMVESFPREITSQESKFLGEVTTANYFEVRVAEIWRESPAPMYDIAVEGVEQYMAQGILVHNSSNPNLQNIPLQGVWAKKIRKGFIAEKNHVLLSFDYSQMELRITAALAKEAKMKTFFEKGLDIHTMTAAEVFGISPGDVSSEMRFRAKALNFGVLYGMGARGFARSSGIPMQEAQDFIDQYFLRFPGILRYMEETKEFARKHGYVETMFGRKRFLPDVNSPTPQIRAAAERMAINHPAQGTAADIMKMAMVRVAEVLDSNPECRMLLQVHDELLLECPDTKAQEFMLPIKKAMEEVLPFDPPLLVEASQGTSWAEL